MNLRHGSISEAFMARVPPGTKVSSVKGEVFDIDEETWEEFPHFGGGRCGILLSYELSKIIDIPDFFTDERGEPFEAVPAAIIVQPFDFVMPREFCDPTDLEYFVGAAWLTFGQVMALEVKP